MTELLPVVADAVAAHGLEVEVLACDPELADTAEFCDHYGFALDDAANTIIVTSKKVEPPLRAVCVVLGTTRLDVNKVCRERLGVKRISFADADTTVELTGMEIGGVTAPGVEGLPLWIDAAVLERPRVVMGGGNRTSKLVLDPRELLKLPGAEVVEGLANPLMEHPNPEHSG
ncbi:MAG: YbaK/EbsC family protein [Candidatus Nanopelagicales bacterium]